MGLIDFSKLQVIVRNLNEILKNRFGSERIIQVPWLYFLNCHSSNLNKYTSVFTQKSSFEIWLEISKSWCRVFLQLIYSIKNSFNKRSGTFLLNNKKVLFVSHLIKPGIVGKDDDFYYGRLPNFIKSKNRECGILLINHLSNENDYELHHGNNIERIVIGEIGNILEEINIIGKSFNDFAILLKLFVNEKDIELKNFLREALINSISGDTFKTLRIIRDLSKVLKRNEIEEIFVTWEGHLWEKLAFDSGRMSNSNITCVAYQHAILFPFTYSLKTSFGKAYDPDYILTIGNVTAEILKSDSDFSDKVCVYGSHKRCDQVSCQAGSGLKSPKILVCPEGIEAENIYLFEFAAKAAQYLPEINFIFRTHPLISIEDIIAKSELLQNLPDNISLSSNINIIDDFQISTWLLYRSSTVAIQSVLAGMRPIYINLTGEIDIDPLFMLDVWRLKISSESDLNEVVRADLAEIKQDEYLEAYKVCNEYILPVNMEATYKIINQKS